MKKTITFTLFAFFGFCFMTMLVGSVSAQSAMSSLSGEEQARQAFERLRQSGQLKEPAQPSEFNRAKAAQSSTKSVVETKIATPLAAGVTGDETSKQTPGSLNLVVMHMDREFVTQGQEISFSMEGIGNYTQAVSVFCQVNEPGFSGQYDQDGVSRYYTPSLYQGGSWLPYGIVNGQIFDAVFKRKITHGDRPGTWYNTCVLTDQNGLMLQQTMNYFHYNVAGPGGLFTWRVDNAIQSMFGNSPIVILKGAFPINKPVYILLGKESLGINRYTYSATSSDGQTLLLARPQLPYRAMEFDVTIFDPESRIHQTKVGALVLQGIQP